MVEGTGEEGGEVRKGRREEVKSEGKRGDPQVLVYTPRSKS